MRCFPGSNLWRCAAVCLLAALPASAIVNPYVDAITNRNVFALKPQPTPEELAPPAPPVQLPTVYLTGITTLMGGKRALLRVARPAKPNEPAKEIPLMLAENGPAEEGVQVLSIDVAGGTVQISNQGTTQLLDITKNSPKAAPAPGVPGGVPPPGGVRPGLPVPLPAAHSGGGIPIPQRPVRGGGAGGDAAAVPNAAMGGGNAAAQPSLPANMPSLEDQIVMIEVNRIRTQHLVDAGEQPPLPPTELQEIIKNENQPGGPGQPGQGGGIPLPQ